MRLGLFVTCTLLAFAPESRAGLVFYTSQSAFDSASTGLSTDTFQGIVSPPTSFNYYGSGSYTSSTGTNYAINRSTSNGNLFINGPDYYTTPAPYPYISSQESTSTNNNLTITFPHAVTAVGFDYASFGATTLTFTLSTGDQFTEATPGGLYPGTFAFIGFTSTSAITSIQITDPITTTSVGFNLSNIAFGAAVPEPPSAALLSAAIAIVVLAKRRWRT